MLPGLALQQHTCNRPQRRGTLGVFSLSGKLGRRKGSSDAHLSPFWVRTRKSVRTGQQTVPGGLALQQRRCLATWPLRKRKQDQQVELLRSHLRTAWRFHKSEKHLQQDEDSWSAARLLF